MTAASLDLMRELMEQSLLAWRLTGSVSIGRDSTIVVSSNVHEVRISPASSDLPFRWLVTVDNRTRGAISVIGVLRQVRTALDPGYTAMRPLIATFPLESPP